jgi:hypothetical protein
VKPDTEYLARQLAGLVLADAGDTGRLDSAGFARVSVELRGMTQGIRREILLDHVSLASSIADQIEQQTEAANLDQLVRDTVKREVERLTGQVESIVRESVKRAVETRIQGAVSRATEVIARDAADRIIGAVVGKP